MRQGTFNVVRVPGDNGACFGLNGGRWLERKGRYLDIEQRVDHNAIEAQGCSCRHRKSVPICVYSKASVDAILGSSYMPIRSTAMTQEQPGLRR